MILNLSLILAFLVSTIWILFNYPNEIQYDQHQILTVFSLDHFKLVGGIALNIIIGGYNRLFSPDPATIDSHMRILTMLLYVIPALLFARKVLTREWVFTLFILFLFTSRFPLLWLCVEHLAGGFFFAFLYTYFSKRPVWVWTFFLFFFGLVKPDIILTSFILFGFLVWKESSKGRRIQITKWFLGYHLVIHLFGFSLHGLDYITSSGGRAYHAVVQHHSDLFYKHQAGLDVPIPFDEAGKYEARLFPKAKTLPQFLKYYPSHYLDFLAMSAMRGFKRISVLFHVLLFFFIFRLILYHRYSLKLGEEEKLIYLSLVGILPMVMLAFPHIRYLARYYPAVIVAILCVFQREWGAGHTGGRKVLSYGMAGSIALGLLVNSILFLKSMGDVGQVRLFWFPD